MFTLDDLNKAIAAKYAPWEFGAGRTKFSLKQIMALPKEQRDMVKAMLQKLDDEKESLDEDDVKAILKAVLDYIVDDNKSQKLFEVLDDDLVKITILFENYVEGSQAGEA